MSEEIKNSEPEGTELKESQLSDKDLGNVAGGMVRLGDENITGIKPN